MSLEGRRIAVRGVVQGVGFRPWIYRIAHEEGIAGRILNNSSGVLIEAFGPPSSLETFQHRLRSSPPPAAAISAIEWERIPAESKGEFQIVPSAASKDRQVSIPPDLATCERCVEEIFNPADRRYRYAFTNCTDCGPRFTIVRDVPYDRPATTMAAFQMCPDCQREYDDPLDRRFHAQPNACPTCGPHLWLVAADGSPLEAEDPIRTAAVALEAGMIVAVKGLGGFHLACDATSERTVSTLRERKRREAKPLAVMLRTLRDADALAELSPADRRLLSSTERPIVLVRRRPNAGIAAAVAPGSPLLGLMLAYTPLHHLLLADAGKPLVMTSGNLSEEPIAYRNAEALHRLGGVADLFLLHDREIETRCDDSVARALGQAPVVLRRSRGYVPRPLQLSESVARPVLACGAHLKNTFCIAVDDRAYLGPHIGDLENLAADEAMRGAIARMERFLGVSPEVIAHDLHPGYQSTAYALERPEEPKVAVQHHHAHVASAIAEHGLTGPVLGLAFDGTGDGGDGTAWGGEFLLADLHGFERLATMRPLPLAGADAAIRRPWRLALALLDDAFDGRPPLEALGLFAQVPPAHIHTVRRMIAAGLQSPLAHGIGRYFDAFGALGLEVPRALYEGDVAMQWNLAADPDETGSYPFTIDYQVKPYQIDLRPLTRAAVQDLMTGESVAKVSARFHNSLIAASVVLIHEIASETGRFPVILTGGSFQNDLLLEGLCERLGGEFDVVVHADVPPGDGGIALGQAVIADAHCKRTKGETPCV
jgi:hydrogenase maturation protein HypF